MGSNRDLPRRVIWRSSGNPIPYVSKRLRLSEYELSEALHNIKDALGLGGADNLIFYDNGDVTRHGEELGNIFDEL